MAPQWRALSSPLYQQVAEEESDFFPMGTSVAMAALGGMDDSEKLDRLASRIEEQMSSFETRMKALEALDGDGR